MICIQHKYALTPNEGIWRHFQQFHKGIPEATRAAIKAFAKSVLVKGPDEVLMPLIEMSPVKGLEVWKDGFKCFHSSCQGYVCGTQRQMENHCRMVHEWTKKEEIQWRRQAVQTFFKGMQRMF